MKISEIQKARPIGQAQKEERIQPTKIVDCLSISSESEKKALWVEMAKELPDIRPEKVDAARNSSPSNHELASKMLDPTKK